MKKLIYLFIVLGITLTGCNPIEDINEEIDAQAGPIAGEVTYTLTTEDYTNLIDQGDDEPADSYEQFQNFSTVDDAKEKIADFLANKYPFWGEGSSADITFNLFQPISIENTVTYLVSDQDYTDSGFEYGNFDSDDNFQVFLTFKYPNAERGDLVELTYNWWAPGNETRTDKFILLDTWKKTTQFSNDDYTAMGQSFPNFSDEEEAIFKIGIYLESLYLFAQSGDEITTLYKNHIGGGNTEDIIAPFTFDGDSWNAIGNTVEASIKFGFKNNVWVPDNTIRYTLIADDYSYMAAQLIAEPGFEGPADNMGFFNSFTTQEGNSNRWSDEMLLVAFDILLDNNAPVAEEGQKYILKYKVYNGSAVVNQETSLIKVGGEWIINTEE